MFCGYYDVSPFRPSNNSQIIVHANKQNNLFAPNCRNYTDILLVDWRSKKIVKKIGSTSAWNWQQGSRLTWLDDNRVVFNIYKDYNYRSKVVNVDTGESVEYSLPVQSVFKDQYFVSIDYTVLSKYRRDYGYFNVRPNPEQLSTSAIYLNKFDCNDHVQITNSDKTRAKLALSNKNKSFWFNHVCISPGGTKIIYLFRYIELDGELKHVLFLYDILQKSNTLLVNRSIVSHYCWLNENEVLFWGKYGNLTGYHKIDVTKNVFQIVNIGDGHPVFIKDNIVLTDTYPDEKMHRKIYTLNVEKKVKYSSLYSISEKPYFNIECRCDMHPSVSNDNKLYQVDISPTGRRKVLVGCL